ncbi:MAG TPA: TPM domain-containing protein [Chthoniobacterales bacterium]|nr:TPM domain-containing protein [Chthoniobacterales bacterium]
MRTKEFLSQLDNERIVAAIAATEARTSGEIRVFVRRGELADDPLLVAQQEFSKLGMQKTEERNGILIFVAPRAQKFAVVGDEGVHQKCGLEFWEKLVATMREHFKRAAFTDALVEAIESAGALLANHFPRQSADRNELPDDIIEG